MLNILVDGLAYGMVLFVIAVGLSVTLGLMRFVNLSHGAFAMVGGYCAALVHARGASGASGWPCPLAVLATGVLGAVLEALVLRHLYRRKELEQVLFTIGLSFVLIATTNALVGPQVQMIPLPPLLAGSVDLGFRTLPTQRLLVIAAGCAVAGARCVVGGAHALRHLAARGGRPQRHAPRRWAFRFAPCSAPSFAAGAALAGLGGILGAELMPLEPYYALKYLVLVLVVVSVGGMGSPSPARSRPRSCWA